MAPAVGWTEQHYYAAVRNARRAWQSTSQQLVLDGVLESTEAPPRGVRAAGVPVAAAASVVSSAPPACNPSPRGRAQHNTKGGGGAVPS